MSAATPHSTPMRVTASLITLFSLLCSAHALAPGNITWLEYSDNCKRDGGKYMDVRRTAAEYVASANDMPHEITGLANETDKTVLAPVHADYELKLGRITDVNARKDELMKSGGPAAVGSYAHEILLASIYDMHMELMAGTSATGTNSATSEHVSLVQSSQASSSRKTENSSSESSTSELRQSSSDSSSGVKSHITVNSTVEISAHPPDIALPTQPNQDEERRSSNASDSPKISISSSLTDSFKEPSDEEDVEHSPSLLEQHMATHSNSHIAAVIASSDPDNDFVIVGHETEHGTAESIVPVPKKRAKAKMVLDIDPLWTEEWEPATPHNSLTMLDDSDIVAIKQQKDMFDRAVLERLGKTQMHAPRQANGFAREVAEYNKRIAAKRRPARNPSLSVDETGMSNEPRLQAAERQWTGGDWLKLYKKLRSKGLSATSLAKLRENAKSYCIANILPDSVYGLRDDSPTCDLAKIDEMIQTYLAFTKELGVVVEDEQALVNALRESATLYVSKGNCDASLLRAILTEIALAVVDKRSKAVSGISTAATTDFAESRLSNQLVMAASAGETAQQILEPGLQAAQSWSGGKWLQLYRKLSESGLTDMSLGKLRQDAKMFCSSTLLPDSVFAARDDSPKCDLKKVNNMITTYVAFIKELGMTIGDEQALVNELKQSATLYVKTGKCDASILRASITELALAVAEQRSKLVPQVMSAAAAVTADFSDAKRMALRIKAEELTTVELQKAISDITDTGKLPESLTLA